MQCCYGLCSAGVSWASLCACLGLSLRFMYQLRYVFVRRDTLEDDMLLLMNYTSIHVFIDEYWLGMCVLVQTFD